MARKVTPQVAAEIRRRHEAGDSLRDIGEALGLAPNTVRTALKLRSLHRPTPVERPPETPPGAEPPPPPREPRPPLTSEEIRTHLSEQVRELRDDAQAAKARGDREGVARANRNLTQTSILLARLTKAEEGDPEGVFVRHDQIAQAAADCRSKLLELVERERSR